MSKAKECKKRLLKYISIIKAFPKMSAKMRKKLVKDADGGLIKTVSECCLNLQKRKVPLSNDKHKKLSKHKKLIRLLSSKATIGKKKKALLQTGSGFFLPLLFSVLTPLITNLIAPSS
jgi:hypothetical protein